jgi:hypothetical protein
MDVMLEPRDEDTWAFRRDPEIRAPRAAMIGHTTEGIPYLRPQGTLLFKPRQHDPRTRQIWPSASR